MGGDQGRRSWELMGDGWRSGEMRFSTHLETRSDDEIEKKVASTSVATALARCVLPVPGGPYSRIPRQGRRSPEIRGDQAQIQGRCDGRCEHAWGKQRQSE